MRSRSHHDLPTQLEGMLRWLIGLASVAARRLLGAARRWHELARQRRALRALDPRMLQDIGITRADALAEAERPFWDDPFAGRG